MMESNRRMVVSCIEEDRISNLIDSILERVPVEDAVSTSILSRKWRYRWTKMRALVFDERFLNKYGKNRAFRRNGFIWIINKVLFLRKGPILKFHLHIPNTNFDIFEEVDQWMHFLSRNSVTELILISSNERYKLPSHVFCWLELTKLELKNCLFKPPLEFEGFPNLEELSLEDSDFAGNMCGTKINLPKLMTLFMDNCTNVYNFNIKATKLQNLRVIACPDAMLLRLLDSPCLTNVVIYLEKPIEDFVRVKKMDLATMLSNMSRVRKCSIDNHFLKFLVAEKIPKLLPHATNSLKSLILWDIQLGDLDQLYGTLCLLRSSPNLQNLRMYMEEASLVDVGPTSNHLESSHCLECTLNQLQTVEITYLVGSKPELLFIELLLAHSPSLEKITMRPTRASDVQKRFGIATDVMQFPRASPTAKMFFLNPKP